MTQDEARRALVHRKRVNLKSHPAAGSWTIQTLFPMRSGKLRCVLEDDGGNLWIESPARLAMTERVREYAR